LRLSLGVGELIADAAHGKDIHRVLLIRFDGVPQTADVDINGTRFHERLVSPDVVEQLLPVYTRPG